MDWKKITISQWASITTAIIFAIGAFYLALSKIWGFPFGEEVNSTCNAISALVASVLGAFTMKKVGTNNIELLDEYHALGGNSYMSVKAEKYIMEKEDFNNADRSKRN